MSLRHTIAPRSKPSYAAQITLVGATGQPSTPGSNKGTNCGSSGTAQTRVGGGWVGGGAGAGVFAGGAGVAGVTAAVAAPEAAVAEAAVAVCRAPATVVEFPAGAGCDVTAAIGASVVAPPPSRSASVVQPTPTANAKMNKRRAPPTQSHLPPRLRGAAWDCSSGMISKSSGFATIILFSVACALRTNATNALPCQ